MAIPPEFNYDSEEDFIKQFLVPLLQQLGFSVVSHYHGTSEYGKDLLFAEVDRFGNVRFHGLQAKYVGNIGLSASHELIQDCDQAFANEFIHPQTGSRGRISTFFAVNGGTISDQAKHNFFNSLKPKYGENVILLEAKDLIVLSRWGTANQREDFVSLLGGLQIEIEYNIRESLQSMRDKLESQEFNGMIPLINLRTESCSAYLRKPFLTDKIIPENVLAYCHTAHLINRELDLARQGIMPSESRQQVFNSATNHIDQMVRLGLGINAQVKEAIQFITGAPRNPTPNHLHVAIPPLLDGGSDSSDSQSTAQ